MISALRCCPFETLRLDHELVHKVTGAQLIDCAHLMLILWTLCGQLFFPGDRGQNSAQSQVCKVLEGSEVGVAGQCSRGLLVPG